MLVSSTTQLRFTSACKRWSRYRKITAGVGRRKSHQCPNMTNRPQRHQSRIYTLLITWNNRGHQHVLHQPTNHLHLCHVRKNSVKATGTIPAGLLCLACYISKEFRRDWRWALLPCNKFVLTKERETMALVLLATDLLTEDIRDQDKSVTLCWLYFSLIAGRLLPGPTLKRRCNAFTQSLSSDGLYCV
jgi:hypothetical protein